VSITIDVERQQFVFGETWSAVIKYDDHHSYRRGPEKLKGVIDGVPQSTRAVDVVAQDRQGRLLLLEAKDFRGHRIENQKRLSSGELALETALKVRDTIAALVGAVQNNRDETAYPDIRYALCGKELPALYIVLWSEDDAQKTDDMAKRQLRAVSDSLKQHLSWMRGARIAVHSSWTPLRSLDIAVSNLPGVGR
jgi:hypothetical protein